MRRKLLPYLALSFSPQNCCLRVYVLGAAAAPFAFTQSRSLSLSTRNTALPFSTTGDWRATRLNKNKKQHFICARTILIALWPTAFYHVLKKPGIIERNQSKKCRFFTCFLGKNQDFTGKNVHV